MSTLRAYCQLCRIPAVFTALADIMLGYLLTHSRIEPGSQLVLILLLGASAGLYLSGMVWNDIFDREQDAKERPKRPIPSGRVSIRAAITFASLLTGIGLACAAAAGWRSLAIAGMLTACIFLYDGVLKKTALGPLFMGACRSLNVILGASTTGVQFASAWQFPQLWVAGSLGVYIVGVTFFARTEAVTSKRFMLVLGAVILNTGLLGLATWISGEVARFGFLADEGGARDPKMVLLILGMIALTINRRIVMAIQFPEPLYVQSGVKMMLLSIIMLDATCIYFKLGDPGMNYAAATACLVIPGLILGKWMSMT